MLGNHLRSRPEGSRNSPGQNVKHPPFRPNAVARGLQVAGFVNDPAHGAARTEILRPQVEIRTVRRTTEDVCGHPLIHLRDERRQPRVGSTADPRRTAKPWH
jgi:hypothetical protein